MIQLIHYQPSFLDSFIGWRSEPSSVGHNPIKQMTRPQIEKMLQSEGADLSDLRKIAGSDLLASGPRQRR